MTNSPLEFLASMYGNVIRYDADGNPGIFVRFPKMKSSELDENLPEHTHPAFIVNGTEQDAILIGRYAAASPVGNGADGGALYSLPNVPPAHSLSADALLHQMRMAGDGITGMTAADRGFLLLLAQRNGWMPKGNSDFGHCGRDAAPFTPGESVAAGDVRGFRGWSFECIQAHTASEERSPDAAPAYWRRLRHIGGTEACADADAQTRAMQLTLSGSGPLSWTLGGAPGGVSDIVGNQSEADYGYRLVDCEIQILADNDAASPDADLTAESAAWRAILPNATNDGCTLVEPGTPGTLHWTWQDGALTLDTQEPEFDGQIRETVFDSLAANSERVPAVPHILRELGIFPTINCTTPGTCAVRMARGEVIPRRGGHYASTSAAIGMGALDCTQGRESAQLRYGARPRAMESIETFILDSTVLDTSALA